MCIVAKADDERQRPQNLLHIPPLHADAAAVDEPHFAEAAGVRLLQVFAGHVADFIRAKRMKIETALVTEETS